jgi:hypothetical protein
MRESLAGLRGFHVARQSRERLDEHRNRVEAENLQDEQADVQGERDWVDEQRDVQAQLGCVGRSLLG